MWNPIRSYQEVDGVCAKKNEHQSATSDVVQTGVNAGLTALAGVGVSKLMAGIAMGAASAPLLTAGAIAVATYISAKVVGETITNCGGGIANIGRKMAPGIGSEMVKGLGNTIALGGSLMGEVADVPFRLAARGFRLLRSIPPQTNKMKDLPDLIRPSRSARGDDIISMNAVEGPEAYAKGGIYDSHVPLVPAYEGADFVVTEFPDGENDYGEYSVQSGSKSPQPSSKEL